MAKVTYAGIADAVEAVHLKDDVHELKIVKASHGAGKADPTKFRTEILIEALDDPTAQGIFHYLGDPNPDGTEKGEAFKLLLTKKFLLAFDIRYTIPLLNSIW